MMEMIVQTCHLGECHAAFCMRGLTRGEVVNVNIQRRFANMNI